MIVLFSEAMKWSWNILALVYSLIFLVILFLAYTGHLPTQLNVIPHYDKPGHVILYGIATYLGHRVLRWRHLALGRRSLPLFPVLFVLFTVTEEGLQSFSPNRSVDMGDLIASFIGIVVGYWLAERDRPA